MRKLVSPFVLSLCALCALLVGFGATSFAADAATPDDGQSLFDLLKPAYEAFGGGHYAYGAALAVILICALIKRYGGSGTFGKWAHGDMGGTLLALAVAMATAMSAALAAPGAVITMALLKSSFLVGVGAAGGYATLKNLVVEPLLKPLAAKAPAWAQPIFALIFWIFDKPSAIQTAEKAGQDAVDAKPAQGAIGVAGKPTEL